MPTLDQSSRVQPRPSPEDWGYKFIESLNGGIDLTERSEVIEDNRLLTAENVRFEKGRILVDYGYKTFAQVVRGFPRLTYQFYLKNGSSILILLTNDTFYRYDETALEWKYVSDGNATQVAVAGVATDTSIEVDDDAGFGDGDFIGIELDDGTQHQTTVNGAPAANIITFDDALPGPSAIASAVVKAADLNGSSDIQPSVTTWAAFDKMYITNGIDVPKEFDGIELVDISNLPASGSFACRIVAIFNNYLIFLHTTEAGTLFPQRMRWSLPGNDAAFDESVNFLDLYDSEDFIVAAEGLGSFYIIYKERSIYRLEFLGLLLQTWNITKTIDSEGTFNQDCVINLGDEHILFGNANIYKYDGNFNLDPVGDEIFDKLFAQDGELNPTYAARTFGIYIEELDEAWWFYPNGSDEFPQNIIRLNISTGAWSDRRFLEAFTGFGFFQAQGDITWATAPGTWAAFTGPWVSKQVQANAPTVHLLSKDTLQVYDYDYVTNEDDGEAIPFEVETKDFYIGDYELRFDRYDFRISGINVLVEASYDQGNNWEVLGTVSPGTVYAKQSLFRQHISRSVRFRFSGSEGFGLEWVGFKFKGESLQNL